MGVEIAEIQWEEYFLIAISFMFLNLVGHAASFHLDAIGRHHTQKMVNKLLGFFFDGLPMPSLETSRGYGENNGVTWGHMGILRIAQKDRIEIYHYFTKVYLFYFSIFLGIATCCFYLNLPDGWFDALGPTYRSGCACAFKWVRVWVGVGPPKYSLIWKMRPDFES